MNLEIGSKKLKDLTEENILDIVKIVGAHSHFDYWHEPIILEFNNTMFKDTVVLDYRSLRKEDNREGMLISFFFNWKELDRHYTKDYDRLGKQQRHHSRDSNYKVIRYLIKEGFDVPIY